MGAAPTFKVYNKRGEYMAACWEAEAAAALVALYGAGSSIRVGHSVKGAVWREGAEEQPAGESYDFVAETVNARYAAMVAA